MNYKVLAFDIDGTLLDSKKQLAESTRRTIMAAAKQGCKIAIATGRPVQGVKDIATELKFDEINGYVISLNGGLVMSWQDKKVVQEHKIPVEYNSLICDLAKEHNVNILTYDGDDVITETPNDKYAQIEANINKINIRQVDDMKAHLDFGVPKFIMLGDGDVLAEVEKKIKPVLEENLDVYRSEPFFLEVLPKGINKANALESLLKEVGASREELMAFGDGYNDISMIEYAGMGVAMANGNDSIKEKADYIAPSNDEDGIAHVLEKFVLD